MDDFNRGDRVIRTGDTFGLCTNGETYTVASATAATVSLLGISGVYLKNCFVLANSAAQADQEHAAKEQDPSGLDQHAPGSKVDAGKVRPALIIEGMARALWAVSEIATFGAAKYTDGGWVLVANGQTRYADAGYRHLLKRAMGETHDPDSMKTHLAHEAWNAIAKLDLYLREQEKVKT